MSQFALNPLSSPGRVAPGKVTPQAPLSPVSAAPAAAAKPAATPSRSPDRVSTQALPQGTGQAHYPLLEGTPIGALAAQLAVPGTLERLQAQLDQLPPAARQVFEKLLPLLDPPEPTLNTLKHLLDSPELSATARQDLTQAVERVSTLLDASQRGDQAAVDTAMQTPLALSPLAPGLSNALDYLRQAVDFDQQMVRFDLRKNVVGVVNQVYDKAAHLSQTKPHGSTPDLARLAVNQTKRQEGSKDEALLSKLVSGEVKQKISDLRSQFDGFLKSIPGYQDALQRALTQAGVQVDSLDQLSNPQFLASIQSGQMAVIAQSLEASLQALPQTDSVNPLRTALNATLRQVLPEAVHLRENFQKFSANMDGYVRETSRSLLTYSQDLGLTLPDAYLSQIERAPGAALTALHSWLQTERSAAQGDPAKIHKLDTLEKFAIQLENGIRVADSVARGDNISPELLDKYLRFQTFIAAERALFEQYTAAAPAEKPRLLEAVLQLGERFADLSQQPTPQLQEALFTFLGTYLPAEALQDMRGHIADIQSGFARYHRDLQQAEDGQISLGDRQRPHRLPPLGEDDTQSQRLAEIHRRSSAYLQHVYAELGSEGLEKALRAELEQVLKTLGQLPPGLLNNPIETEATEETSASETAAPERATRSQRAAPDTLDFVDPGQQASARLQKMESAVAQIKDGLLRSLKAHESERKALQQAQQLRSQIQDQLFNFHNDRQHASSAHQQQRLQELDQELAALLAQQRER